jgi:hypothetical protein
MRVKSQGGMIWTGRTEELGEKPVQRLFVHHKSHMD